MHVKPALLVFHVFFGTLLNKFNSIQYLMSLAPSKTSSPSQSGKCVCVKVATHCVKDTREKAFEGYVKYDGEIETRSCASFIILR